DQGMLQARIDALKDKLARAFIVAQRTLPKDTVVFGTRVRIKDLANGEEEDYELVGPGDEDYDNNRILTTSPRGQGLLGKKVGEIAELKVPRGVLKSQIVDISASDYPPRRGRKSLRGRFLRENSISRLTPT